jgi:hypothetical protein
MDELDIINDMLAAVGSNGVTSTVGRHPALMKARPILDRTHEAVQARGHWFNRDVGLTLSATVDGEIFVPQNTIKCDTTEKRLRYVRRGRRMYDPHNHTYQLDVTSLEVDVVLKLDYDLLPFSVLDYIRAKAVMQMLVKAEADHISVQAAQADLQDTKIAFENERRQQADTSLRDNPEYAAIMSGLPRMYMRSTNPNNIGG